ncbi:penicillin-binding protein [Polycladomyces sp. WAk]|uniref:Penicillin-binding protein n=1 Tax=Polycladomyces zharkentensis TaxID=2807616 RepID=A0ABS2WH79_9BACL|nr:transglycosylase domain-containing protein [Polycladomyces sp. WAk]MBN2908774.1 penicillin-binding protein [Polycladomyces sp. WAk]
MEHRDSPSSPAAKKQSLGFRIFKGFLYTLFFTLVLVLTLSVGAAGVVAGYVASLVKDQPVLSKADFEKKLTGWSQNSQAFFRDGQLIGQLRGDENRKLVTAEQVSPYLIKAFIATEDQEFYQHHGVVPKALFRAALQQVMHSSVTTGGSTITQQVVKNTILQDQSQTHERKAREIFIALRMEKMFSKKDILNAYLNSTYYGKDPNGRNMLGVEAAAKGIFDVSAKDLNLAQAAYIAGMVQRPNAYNPFFADDGSTLKAGKERMKVVLDRMLKTHKITKQEYDQALAFNLQASLAKPKPSAYEKYRYVMDAVEKQAAEALMKLDGRDPVELRKQGKYWATLEEYRKRVLTGGYRIETTLDKNLLDTMEQATERIPFAPPADIRVKEGPKGNRKWVVKKNQLQQVGATLIDVKTGALLAFVGGRETKVNHALDYPRQPGSTMKPLLDYGPALDLGLITPETKIKDEELKAADGTGKTYRNASKKYAGDVTAREALAKSLNIPAIKVFRMVGKERAFSYLEKMGFRFHPYDGEASAIGGLTYGFTVQRMTSGYAALANQGKFNEPYMIQKIIDSTGKVVYEHKPNPVQVYSPRAAYATTDMLRDVIKNGTGKLIGQRIRGYDIAGKSGTTQNQYDVWFIGYSPRVALGVWVGYDYNKKMYNDTVAKEAWATYFKAIMQADPNLQPKGERFAALGLPFII